MDNNSSYQKIASHEAHKGSFKKCLLLYSGGLDTSTMLKWIQDEYNAEVIALTVDVGQIHEDLNAAREKALHLGATEALVVDVKDRFADTVLQHAIKMNAKYQGDYHLSTPLGRVMLSEVAVEYAKKYGCEVIAHGCTGKGNDQVRFETYVMALDNTLKTIAPVREWSMGRNEQIAYAKQHGIEVLQTAAKPYSYDDNMWGSTGEGGEIENPELVPPLKNILQVCTHPQEAPDESEQVVIGFEKGIPVSIDSQSMKLSSIVAALNQLGAKHGVGITHLIEDRMVGIKVRGVYESPAANIIIAAHYNLEKIVNTRDTNFLKAELDTKWSDMVYAAKWFDPAVSAMHAFADVINERVSGEVTVDLYKGSATVVSVASPYSLFDAHLATFNKDAAFNQNASAGFIELHALPQKTYHSLS